jgi:pimeloyl-ACP methyl ester carboxylesterase
VSRIAGALALSCAALSLATPTASAAQPSTLAFGACAPTQVFVPTPGVQCATLDVPFDRANPAIGDIALAVQRVPASGPRAGVIVLLAGGPGQPALPGFEGFLAPLAREPALRDYEVVAFDQRGTGQSQGLQCPEARGALRGGVASYLGACGSYLGATRPFYTSQESVEDLNSLREALGGTPLSLFAVSYGTRVAGMYAREHPQGVARMVLDSPTPTTGSDPLFLSRVRALRRVLDEGICGAGACRSFSSDVYADLTRLVVKLHSHPLRTRIYDGHGRLHPAIVTEAGLLRLLYALDVSQGERELAPAAIVAAADGYAAPLARLTHYLQAESPGSELSVSPSTTAVPTDVPEAAEARPGAAKAPASDAEISSALFGATYCVESELPWSPDSAPASRAATVRGWLAALPSGATAPFAPTTLAADSGIGLCKDWPATPPAPPSPTGVSTTPTLILSGDDDLRTPYEQALTIAASYSDAKLLRVPDVGHSTVTLDRTGCAKGAMIEFLTSGQAPAKCAGTNEPQALPLPPASLSQLHPLPSRSRLVGQVAAAVAITLEDLYGQTGTSGGGLRGGYWRVRGQKAIVHSFVDVRGVAISGSISMSGVAHFTVHGRLDGTLSQRGLVVTGHLGGMPVHLRLVGT